MKRIFNFLPIILSMSLFVGCGTNETTKVESSASQSAVVSEEVVDEKETETSEVEEKVVLEPIYADNIVDGTYEIEVDSSSSMFKVVKCELTVENGEMKAAMTMSGQGYGFLYMGTEEEALADSEDTYIPFEINEDEQKVFTVPVEALNLETDCAAWSIKKEKWYDRVLVFESDLMPEEAFK